MLLTLVIILLLIWAAVVGALYSGFLTFYNNFSETENYNKAYYAAIAALERSELVVKQHEPWYEWSWWWVTKINFEWNEELKFYWSGSDWASTWFSYLSSWNSRWTSVLWNIKSKASRIPATWWWDVDWTLSTWDSLNYNTMDYENAEIFLLYYDPSTKWPYEKVSCQTLSGYQTGCQKATMSELSWEIRLPAALVSALWPLDTWSAHIGRVSDDAIVDWQIRWNYWATPFTVYSTQDTFEDRWVMVVWNQDTVIRESDINGKVRLSFSWSKSPILAKQSRNIMTVISSSGSEISWYNYTNMFESNDFNKLQLRLALLNLLKPREWAIYPYLEYYLSFWTWIADKYYTMDAEWKYGDFQVNLIVQKPTAKESILWSFTTVF